MDRLDAVADIREFNRFYTSVLGLLGKNIMHSGYSLTEARILFEIGKMEHCTANRLCALLDIDRSYMSRIIAKFEKLGLITRVTNKADSRSIEIRLSKRGKTILRQLNDLSNKHIEKMIMKLSDEDGQKITDAMHTIKKYLTMATVDLHIRPYEKADVRYVIDRQLSLYETERRFTSPVWKKYVTEGVMALADTFNPEKECMFILECNGNPAGCVAIVHAPDGDAQFRYFFLEPELRGLGAGWRLMNMALDFCREKRYKHIFLWTVSAQETARHLYEKAGFHITETKHTADWGVPVLEERWDLFI
jgi:Transcriptional regulators